MPKTKLQAATLGGTADDIEAVFYDALKKADIELLMSCWADEEEVICVHPGGPRLVGVMSIRAAFELLFSQGPLAVRPERVHRIDALASAVHSVLECISLMTEEGPREAWIVATNVYHKTPHGWRMVAHHASPGSPHDLSAERDSSAVLH
jgi:ketosteroid isomerase-like protein